MDQGKNVSKCRTVIDFEVFKVFQENRKIDSKRAARRIDFGTSAGPWGRPVHKSNEGKRRRRRGREGKRKEAKRDTKGALGRWGVTTP